MTVSTFELIESRRLTLANQLTTLTPPQWDTQSLCDAWTVRDVVGHVVMPFTHSTAQVIFGMVKERGSFHRFSQKAAHGNAAQPTDELIGLLRDNAANPWAPPGGELIDALTDLTVHSIDIARPCGIDPELDEETARAVLDSVVRPKALKSFGTNVIDLHLEATDLDWSHGDGQLVSGSAVDLLIWLTGRAGASLDGDGSKNLDQIS